MADLPNSARRSLLKAIPFIGAAGILPVTVGVSAAQAAAERARHHWAEFAKAMDELTADANGWRVDAGGQHALGEPLTKVHYLQTAMVRHVEDEYCTYELVEPFSISA